MHRKDLESDVGLVDKFVDLLSDGQGLSNDESVFKNWMLDVMINDKSKAPLWGDGGIGGEWKRRIDEHFKKWPPRPEAGIEA